MGLTPLTYYFVNVHAYIRGSYRVLLEQEVVVKTKGEKTENRANHKSPNSLNTWSSMKRFIPGL